MIQSDRVLEGARFFLCQPARGTRDASVRHLRIIHANDEYYEFASICGT
jgi:hypothetical protein